MPAGRGPDRAQRRVISGNGEKSILAPTAAVFLLWNSGPSLIA
ncbi:hypothetical protein CPter291_5102 [Collimonas pratensis]|uniref:Uncharacterized protein n=1 Tax=Collimonas pratensis TaxID=279113 RepID=A0ABN4MI57_9BURK|nr:hypothetical protein CPter291_5102 [Collimonas pratensis]